jgi:hypothetical protein
MCVFGGGGGRREGGVTVLAQGMYSEDRLGRNASGSLCCPAAAAGAPAVFARKVEATGERGGEVCTGVRES